MDLQAQIAARKTHEAAKKLQALLAKRKKPLMMFLSFRVVQLTIFFLFVGCRTRDESDFHGRHRRQEIAEKASTATTTVVSFRGLPGDACSSPLPLDKTSLIRLTSGPLVDPG